MSEVLASDHQLVIDEIGHEKRAWWPPEPPQPSGGIKADDAAVAVAAAAGGGGPVTAKDDPKYAKFFKMLKVGTPRDAVEIKMKAEGHNASLLDAPDTITSAGGGGAAADATAAATSAAAADASNGMAEITAELRHGGLEYLRKKKAAERAAAAPQLSPAFADSTVRERWLAETRAMFGDGEDGGGECHAMRDIALLREALEHAKKRGVTLAKYVCEPAGPKAAAHVLDSLVEASTVFFLHAPAAGVTSTVGSLRKNVCRSASSCTSSTRPWPRPG